jgi:Zn-dependent protease
VFGEQSQSALDLRFRLFGVHVRVQPFFWLISALFGWDVTQRIPDGKTRLLFLSLWVGCVFASVLLHEFGHVVTGRLFGSDAHVVLTGFGGVAVGSSDVRRRWQRILVSFAGPLAQFLLLGVVYFNMTVLPPYLPPAWRHVLFPYGLWGVGVLAFLFWINLVWPIFNLLPIWPLDGGKITREVCAGVIPRWGVFASLLLSLALCAFIVVQSATTAMGQPLVPHLPYGEYFDLYFALLFGYIGFTNLMALRAVYAAMRRPRVREDEFAWPRR